VFGEASAGGSASRILPGIAVGIVTGGLGYVAGPAVMGIASVSAGEAIASGVVAGVATAAGASPKVGFCSDGNGNNARMESGFRTKEGRDFTFRTGEWNKKDPNAWKYSDEKVKEEFEERKKYEEEQERILRESEREKEEEDYRQKMREDINWSFNTSIGWNYEKVTTSNEEIPRRKIRNGAMGCYSYIRPDERIPNVRANNSPVFEEVTPKSENYDCVTNGKSKIMAESGSRQWEVRKGRKYKRFSKFTPEDENGRLALKSFIFEETPLVWHFDRKNINGEWFNHAWTDTDMDVLVPEGKRVGIPAPEWFSAYRQVEIKEMSKHNPSVDNLKLAKDVAWRGYYNEFLWSNVRAVNLMAENRIEESQAAVRQGLDYYDEAHRIYRDMKHTIGEVAQSTGEFIADFFLAGGIDNYRKYAGGRLSAAEYERLVREENLENMAAIATGATCGAGLGASVGAVPAAVPLVGQVAASVTIPVGATVGAATGAAVNYTVKRFTVAMDKALERSSRRDSNISYRKDLGRNSKNFKGPKIKAMKDAKGKEPADASNARATPVGENGTFWKSINTGSKQLKDQLRSYAKKSWGKGEVRTDGKHYYQFDRMHKGKPGEHLHRYYKDGKKAVPDAEIDPETGNVKRAINGGLGEPWF